MIINELQNQIQLSLETLEQKNSTMSQNPSLETMLQILDEYVNIMDDLFGDDQKPECYVQKLNNKSSKKDVDFFLVTLNKLIKNINSLPFESSIKRVMLTKITDNCSIEFLSQFEQGKLDAKGYNNLLESLQPKSITDTVEVKTWATKREISSGLRNVIQQQLQGEGVGHASVTMRLAADAKGQELVQKYCLNEDGSIKLPFELKKYGKELVYEIYWSYWPNGLQNLENDILTEISGVEHKDNLDILIEMPLELKSRYLNQKYTKNIQIPVLGNLDSSKKRSIFQSPVKNSRIMGLSPAAEYDVSHIEPDIYRRNYLDLKLQQFTLSEEINSLNVIIDNYLSRNKPLSAEHIEQKISIKINSNFLVLLKRFKPEFANQQMVAHILLNKEITSQQSKDLLHNVRSLISRKESDSKSIGEKIYNACDLIEEHHGQVKVLKSRIKELEASIQTKKQFLPSLDTILTTFEKARRPERSYDLANDESYSSDAYNLTTDELECFDQFKNTFKDETSRLINEIIEKKSINHLQANSLDSPFNTYKTNLKEKIQTESSQYIAQTTELRDLYSLQKEKRLEFVGVNLEQINSSILINKSEQEQFSQLAEKLQEKFSFQKKINSAQNAFALVDDLIVAEIEGAGFSKKKGKKSRTSVNTSELPLINEITYESMDGLKTETFKSFEELIQLRYKINEDLEQLKKNIPGTSATEEVAKKGVKKISRQDVYKFHNADGEVTRTIRGVDQIDKVKTELSDYQDNLLKRKDELLLAMARIKIGTNKTAEELSESKIRRGSSNNALLKGFNVEKMLEKASELISSNTHFHLGNENCSTTSMKILHAGSPEETQSMFEWHQAREGEAVASNAFLTNPQTVYSSAKLVERASQGDVSAQKIIKRKQKKEPDRTYNALLNQLAAGMTSSTEVNINLPGKPSVSPEKASSNFSWSFYLQFIPYLIKLYRDFFKTVTLEEERQPLTLSAKVAQEIKALSGEKYHLIESPNPSLAIHRMLEALTHNKTQIPFFAIDTLSRVEHYILSMELKEDKSTEELNIIENYKLICSERDSRIQCIENTILAGADCGIELEKRESSVNEITWTMSKADKLDALLKNFAIKYQEIRNNNPLSFLTSNFLSKLDLIEDPEQQFKKIQQQIAKFPHARSSKALQECLTRDEILKDLVQSKSHLENSVNYGRHSALLFKSIPNETPPVESSIDEDSKKLSH